MVKILFPTDFSDTAENAFFYALQLTRKLKAELTLLHIYELPDLGRTLHQTSKEIFEMMEMETLENFKKSVEQLRRKAELNGYSDVDFKHQMTEGEVVHKIVSIAKKEKVDYIVMGTTGATGLKEIFLGSTASGVIDTSPCCVLSIPDDVNAKNTINKIAYLTNYKDEEVVSFNEVSKFADFFEASICSMHFEKDISEVSEQQMEDWKKKLGPMHENIISHLITGDNLEEAISELYLKENIDVIAIQPRKRNFFAQIFRKSVTKQVVHRLSIPLLTLPAK